MLSFEGPQPSQSSDLDLTLVHSGMMATVLEMMLAYNVRFGPWRNAVYLVVAIHVSVLQSFMCCEQTVVESCLCKCVNLFVG